MYEILTPANLPTRMQQRLATAVDAMRLASTIFDAMCDVIHESESARRNEIYVEDAHAGRVNTRLYAAVLQEHFGEMPDVSPRVFNTIAVYPNDRAQDIPGILSLLLALGLASRALGDWIELARAMPGDEWSDLDEVIIGAEDIVRHYAALFGGLTFLDVEMVLDAILKGERVPTGREQLAEMAAAAV